MSDNKYVRPSTLYYVAALQQHNVRALSLLLLSIIKNNVRISCSLLKIFTNHNGNIQEEKVYIAQKNGRARDRGGSQDPKSGPPGPIGSAANESVTCTT